MVEQPKNATKKLPKKVLDEEILLTNDVNDGSAKAFTE